VEPDVIRIGAPAGAIGCALRDIFARFGLALAWVADGAAIPGSYWGEPEAGLIGAKLYVRVDTPVHSALHEGCHYVCADESRRALLDTDAGGDDLEECAVCYLSIVLADGIATFGRARMLADMDAWGYSFRLGSSARWFAEDADDAREWLHEHGLPTAGSVPRSMRR